MKSVKNYVRRILADEDWRASISYLAAVLLTQGGAILVLPVYVRFFSAAEFATIALAELLGAAVAAISTFGFDGVVSRLYHEWRHRGIEREMSQLLFGFSIALTFLLGSAFYAVRDLLPSSFFPESFARIGVIGSLCLLSTSTTLIPSAYVRITRKTSAFVVLRLGAFLLGPGLSCFLIGLMHRGIQGYFFSFLTSGLWSLAFGIFHIGLPRRMFGLLGELRDAIRFSFPLAGVGIVGVLGSQCDRLIISFLSSPEALAPYAVALRLSNAVGMIHGGVKMSFVPLLFEAAATSDPVKSEKVQKSSVFFAAILMIVGAGVCVISPLLISNGDPRVGLAAQELLPTSVAAAVFLVLPVYFSHSYSVSKKTWRQLAGTIGRFLVLVPLAVLLVPRFAASGMATASALASLIFFMATLFLGDKKCSAKFSEGKSAALLILAFLAFLIVQSQIRSHSLWFRFSASLSLWAVLLGLIVVILQGPNFMRFIARNRRQIRFSKQTDGDRLTD